MTSPTTTDPTTTGGAGLTAEATARRVLGWALETCRPAGGVGPGSWRVDAPSLLPPSGQLREAAALAHPDADTVDALRALTRCTAARLGAGAPPFGDTTAVGLGALLLAAAIGGRAQPDPAALLAETIPPPRLVVTGGPAGWADAVARHSVVAPFLDHAPLPTQKALQTKAGPTNQAGQPAHSDDAPSSSGTPSLPSLSAAGGPPAPNATQTSVEPLVETLLAASPLSAVLHRPARSRLVATGTTRAEVEAAVGLLSRPRGPAVLAAALSAWSADPWVLGWRTELLTVLTRPDSHPEFVADVFLTARLRHGPPWDAALRSARSALSSRRTLPDPGSIATARYWLPLANLHRSTDLVRRRPRLLAECRPALALVEAHRNALMAVHQ